METETPAKTPERKPAEFDFGTFGGKERRSFKLDVEDVRDSGAGEGQFTIRGHAAVFDKWSLDLGGFREKVDPQAFDNVLSRNPDVRLNWDHDTRWMLARTANKTLELRTDPAGLHYWGRVAPTSYATDLRILMERGDIDEASFAFTVAKDKWEITGEGDDEKVERTILEVGELYDVTVTAMGAYPQTDSQVVRKRALDYAHERGLIPEDVAPVTAGDEESREGSEEVAPDAGLSALEELKRTANEAAEAAKAEHQRLLKEITR